MPALTVLGCQRPYTVLAVSCLFQFETLHYPWIPSYLLYTIFNKNNCLFRNVSHQLYKTECCHAQKKNLAIQH
jgi:hypothetical protein